MRAFAPQLWASVLSMEKDMGSEHRRNSMKDCRKRKPAIKLTAFLQSSMFSYIFMCFSRDIPGTAQLLRRRTLSTGLYPQRPAAEAELFVKESPLALPARPGISTLSSRMATEVKARSVKEAVLIFDPCLVCLISGSVPGRLPEGFPSRFTILVIVSPCMSRSICPGCKN